MAMSIMVVINSFKPSSMIISCDFFDLNVLLFSETTSVAVFTDFPSNENVPALKPVCMAKMFSKALIAETCSSTLNSTEMSCILFSSVLPSLNASYTSSVSSKYRYVLPVSGSTTVLTKCAGTMILFRPSRNSLLKLSNAVSNALIVSKALAKILIPNGLFVSILFAVFGLKYTNNGLFRPLILTSDSKLGNNVDNGTSTPSSCPFDSYNSFLTTYVSFSQTCHSKCVYFLSPFWYSLTNTPS